MIRKGIILAAGRGTRLYPLTAVCSKQLQPVHDKPMIYYPLTTLLLLGVREICFITTPEDFPLFERLLGDGSRFGAHFEFLVQEEPRGIADALLIGEVFTDGDPCALMLGDNLFHGNLDKARRAFREFWNQRGALIFGYPVSDPERYGVVSLDHAGRVREIVEKPSSPPSNLAVPGLYLYDDTAADRVRALLPSERGEMEITDLNRSYLESRKLKFAHLGRGLAWLDTGTPEALLQAAEYVHAVQERQGLLIGSPEEAAVRTGLLKTADDFNTLLATLPEGWYRDRIVTAWQERRL